MRRRRVFNSGALIRGAPVSRFCGPGLDLMLKKALGRSGWVGLAVNPSASAAAISMPLPTAALSHLTASLPARARMSTEDTCPCLSTSKRSRALVRGADHVPQE
jgi:hypothetical protein